MLMFVSNKASNNDTLASSLQRRVSMNGGLFDGCQHCVRCFTHILNLVMQVSLFHLTATNPFDTK